MDTKQREYFKTSRLSWRSEFIQPTSSRPLLPKQQYSCLAFVAADPMKSSREVLGYYFYAQMENIVALFASIGEADHWGVNQPLFGCSPEAGGGSMEYQKDRVIFSIHFTPWISSVENFLVCSFASGVQRLGHTCYGNREEDRYQVCLVGDACRERTTRCKTKRPHPRRTCRGPIGEALWWRDCGQVVSPLATLLD